MPDPSAPSLQAPGITHLHQCLSPSAYVKSNRLQMLCSPVPSYLSKGGAGGSGSSTGDHLWGKGSGLDFLPGPIQSCPHRSASSHWAWASSSACKGSGPAPLHLLAHHCGPVNSFAQSPKKETTQRDHWLLLLLWPQIFPLEPSLLTSSSRWKQSHSEATARIALHMCSGYIVHVLKQGWDLVWPQRMERHHFTPLRMPRTF